MNWVSDNKAWTDVGFIQHRLNHLANALTFRCMIPQALSLKTRKCPEESNIYMTESLSFYIRTYFILKKALIGLMDFGQVPGPLDSLLLNQTAKWCSRLNRLFNVSAIIDRLHWSIYCCEDSVDVLLSGEYIIGLHYNSHLP